MNLWESSASTCVENGVEFISSILLTVHSLVCGNVLGGQVGGVILQLFKVDDFTLLQDRKVLLCFIENISLIYAGFLVNQYRRSD